MYPWAVQEIFFFLYFLVRKIKPSIIVETGVAAGWSSLFIISKNGNYILVISHILD